MDGIISLFEQYTGNRCQDCVPLPKSGSNRKYFRLTDATGFSAIGTEGEDVSENRSFIALSEHLASKGIAVPRILAVDRDCTSYIQTDLGDTSLYDMLALSQNCANTALSFVAEYPVPSGMVSQGTAIPLLIYDSKKC